MSVWSSFENLLARAVKKGAHYDINKNLNCATLVRRIVKSAVGAGMVLCATVPVLAQGCALCYTQAASASARFIHGLRSGILVLVFPPLLISVGLATAAYRKREKFQCKESQAQDTAALGADRNHEEPQ